MYKSNTLRIFPLILIVVVIIALIAGMITVGKYLFTDKQEPVDEATVTAQDELLTLNVSRSVQMTIRGPIVADEEFKTERIVVSPVSREYKTYSGYLDSVQNSKSYDNNNSAYEEFVYALDKADFTRSDKKSSDEPEDIRGICATGKIYEFEILNANEPVKRYWTSTCKGSSGTFRASVEQVTNLFAGQIPEGERPTFSSGGLRF